jgi:SAM-dependent methyltransferase
MDQPADGTIHRAVIVTMVDEAHAHAAGPLVDGRSYDACYYERYGGRPYHRNPEWLTFFGGIADRIVADIRPGRVLDAGCALGLLVETLRARAVNAVGIDFSAFAIEQVHGPVKPFCRQASVTDPLREQYDLIVCLEVLEHLTAADSETAIANFCAHTGDILFSSSPFHFAEATHLNTQPPEYWAARFARHGFYRDVDFDASFVAPWAARFRHRTDPPHRIVGDYERAFSQVVIERNELRALAVETAAEISRSARARDEAETHERSARAAADTTRAAAETTRAELDASTQELARARATIALMKRSWFWRVRQPWEWISRQIGRSTGR